MPLNKKDLQQIKEVVDESIETKVPPIVEKVVEPYFTAIQNDFNRNFEEHQKNSEEHQKFFDELKKNSEEHKDMQSDLRNIGRRVMAIEDFLAGHGNLLKEHSVMLNNIGEDIKELKESGRITKEQFLDLEKRVGELEMKI